MWYKEVYKDWRDRECIFKYVKKRDREDAFGLYRCDNCRGFGQYTENGLILDCENYKPIGGLRVRYGER